MKGRLQFGCTCILLSFCSNLLYFFCIRISSERMWSQPSDGYFLLFSTRAADGDVSFSICLSSCRRCHCDLPARESRHSSTVSSHSNLCESGIVCQNACDCQDDLLHSGKNVKHNLFRQRCTVSAFIQNSSCHI